MSYATHMNESCRIHELPPAAFAVAPVHTHTRMHALTQTHTGRGTDTQRHTDVDTQTHTQTHM